MNDTKQYRVLIPVEDTVQIGDLCWHYSKQRLVGSESLGGPVSRATVYLRPIPSPTWTAYTTRLPNKDEYPVFVTDGVNVHIAAEMRQTDRKPLTQIAACHFDYACTHWQRAIVPQLPTPEKSDAEIAWEKYSASMGDVGPIRTVFIAGFNAAKGAVK